MCLIRGLNSLRDTEIGREAIDNQGYRSGKVFP